MIEENICPICSKIFIEYNAENFLETGKAPEYCDSCGKGYCSDECAKLEAYESTFPNCCPGVYWCVVCRTSYLNLANGHLFIRDYHLPSNDLTKYLGDKFINGGFIDKCMTCGIWCYEFKSNIDNLPGKYEGISCENFKKGINKS